MTVILTLGSFDLMHNGHIELFEACRKIVGPEGSVVVSVNTSEFIAEFKGRLPVQTTDERVSMVRAVRYVDSVVVLDSQDAKPLIEMVDPDFIIIGSDWAAVRPDGSNYLDQLTVTGQWLRDHQIILLFQYREGLYSTTNLKERVREA